VRLPHNSRLNTSTRMICGACAHGLEVPHTFHWAAGWLRCFRAEGNAGGSRAPAPEWYESGACHQHSVLTGMASAETDIHEWS
jgi:hypothetical protein